MNIVLSKRELEKLKNELNVATILEVELVLLNKIPEKYRSLVKFQKLPSGTLCVNIDDRVTLSLYKEFHPHKYSETIKNISNEVNKHKAKLLVSMPTLALTLTSVRKRFIECLDRIVKS